MTDITYAPRPASRSAWRIFGWTAAGCLVLAPLVAMQFTREVQWDAFDFLVFGGMVLFAGLGLEALLRRSGGVAYRTGAALTTLGLFLLVWVNLAVGIIGSEDNPANLLVAGVIAIGIGGAIVTRGRAVGMARVLGVMAIVQAAIAGFAVIAGIGTDGPIWPRDVIGANGMFVVIWMAAAALFHLAARRATN